MKITLPAVFSESERVHACFTYANRELVQCNGEISGLNFGLNTSASKEEIENHLKLLFQRLNWRGDEIALARQVHGTKVKVVDKPGIYDQVDGLVTSQIGLTIGIQVADCAAILIADERAGVAGAFHAGWRGAADQIVPAGLKVMESEGATISDLKVYVGPGISVSHFEVGEEVSVRFPESCRLERSGEKPRVDLRKALELQLLDAGVNPSNVEIDPNCTYADHTLYSYRREGTGSGRMLAAIQLKMQMS